MGEKIKEYFSKNQNVVGFLSLLLFCYLLLFLRLGFYPLVDVDETRYVGISANLLNQGDWITMILNGAPFLEKPPLYFWLNALFFNFCGDVNPLSARFMTAFLAMFSVIFTYFFARKTLGSNYALIASFILLSNLWFLLFSHIAILDMGFMVFTMSAIYSAVLSQFCTKSYNGKYCWYFGWLFMGLAVLMKGIIGFIIPAMVVFLYFLSIKKVKELFKPVNFFPGLLIFLFAVTPWHYSIFTEYDMRWIEEYIIKHHFSRFLDSAGLGRKQPFLFYIPIIFAGFIPWTFNMISAFVNGCKALIREVKSSKTFATIFSADTNDRKILLFASIYFLSVFLFFSVSSTKLPSYILTLFPALALLTAYYWWGYIVYNKYEKGIKISTVIGSIFFIIVGIVGYILVNFITPAGISREIALAQSFSSQLIGWVMIIPLISILCLSNKNRALLFITKLVFMFGVIMIATTYIFGYMMQFGQRELEEYAQDASLVYDSKLVTFDFANKYSVMNTFGRNIEFLPDIDFESLDKIVQNAKEQKVPVFIIIKNKNYNSYSDKFADWQLVKVGEKYSLFAKFFREKDKMLYPQINKYKKMDKLPVF